MKKSLYDYKVIKSVDEITEEDVFNRTKFSTEYNKFYFFEIEKDTDGSYYLYGHVCGDMPTTVCKGTYVQSWKTLNNVKRAIKNFAKKGSWGFFKWFPKEDLK
jgi:hypothetical protein